jgi:hypothetical protein
MLRMFSRQGLVWGAALTVLAWTTTAVADQPQPQAFWAYAEAPQVVVVTEGSQQPGARPGSIVTHGPLAALQMLKPSDYFVGLACSPVPEALRSHLGLKEGQGLLVEQVLPNSPAATAKLERFDVVVKAGDKPLGTVQDLVAAVDAAKDKKIVLELYRQGKATKAEVTPAKRPAGLAFTFGGLSDESNYRARIGEDASKVEFEIRRAIDEAKKAGKALPNIVIREFKPGVMLPPGSPNMAALPGNVSITVTKKGNEPTKVTVTRGDQKWEITENELDKLPLDFRPMVERTLAGLTMRAHGTARIHVAPPPGAPATVAPSKEPDGIQKKLDQLDRKIDEIRKSLDELRAARPAKAEK